MLRWWIITAAAGSVLWLPILLRFVVGYRRRGNPVSLAIAALIVLTCGFAVPVPLLIATGTADANVAVPVTIVIHGSVCALFYWSFWWSDKKFTEERSER